MATAETENAIEVAVRIAASPETVFDFFTDPDKMVQWMGRSAELDARPGGVLRCDMNGRNVAGGKFIELDPPWRIVFSWGWEGDGPTIEPGGSTVEVLLAPDGDGTHLRLIHSDLPTEESAERHAHGWRHYTGRLAAVAAGDDPGADPWATPEGPDSDN